ncbi:MAG: magnesium transporter MgtE N-terminal domain-containing protein [Gemmataceae bacterium]
MAETPATNWHRLFGLILTDFFDGSPFRVETELDVSKVEQFIDVVVIRKEMGKVDLPLPDGMEDLAPHNIISFKSYQEGFTSWSAKELIAYYVNYRKQLSDPMLPEDRFRLFAVCARFPRDLGARVTLEEVQPGVYDCDLGIERIRVIVISRLPQESQNALLQLFSAQAEQVQFAQQHYQQRSARTSSLLQQLLTRYQEEGVPMPVDLDKWVAEFRKEQFIKMDPKERSELVLSLAAEERREFFAYLDSEGRRNFLETLPFQERRDFFETLPFQERRDFFETLPSEERRRLVQNLPPEEGLVGLSPEELFKNLSPEEIKAYLKRLECDPEDQTDGTDS